jgi:hypothetical protein
MTMWGEKCELINLPNTDVLLEIIGTSAPDSRFFRKRLFFPFRPLVGDDVYFEGDVMRQATVAIVDWFICGEKSGLQVRLESDGLDIEDIAVLVGVGWVECEDPAGSGAV